MPYLSIPSYTLPSGVVLVNAYGRIVGLHADLSRGEGRQVLNIYPNAAAFAAGKPPADQLSISFGQAIAPGVTAPTMAAFFATPLAAPVLCTTVQDGETALATVLYQHWLLCPALAGATVVA